jgi:hypothetical protein
VPVYNVSLPVLRKIGLSTLYYVHELPLWSDAKGAGKALGKALEKR